MGEQGIKQRIKICHRFKHEKYNEQINIYEGRELQSDDLEFPLNVNGYIS